MPGDEPQISGGITEVDIDSVKLKIGKLPPIQRNKIAEKRPPILDPRGPHTYATPAVVGVGAVLLVLASVDTGRDAIEQSPAMLVVRYDVCVGPKIFDPVAGLFLSADIARSRTALTQVVIVHPMSRSAAVARDPYEGRRPIGMRDHGKRAEPVANARQRVLSLETSSLAGSQVRPVNIK